MDINYVHTSRADEVEDLFVKQDFNINDWYGYIYMTVDLKENWSYIGKKNFFLKQNKKLGKKEIAALPTARGRKPSTKEVITESDWKTYYGSSETIKALPDKNKLKRYLLRLCKTKTELTYWETKYLFQYEVLENERFINNTILGKFFKGDFVNS